MSIRALTIALVFPVLQQIQAASTPEELVTELMAAFTSKDREAFRKFFNFNSVDPKTQLALKKIEDDLFSWSSHHITSSSRDDSGALDASAPDGTRITLNGNWLGFISIHLEPPPSKGFVFSTGTSNGEYKILMPVRKEQ